MEVFRISDRRHADLSGKGGIYSSGRWHTKGFPIIYTAGSRSLSMLERYTHESSLQNPTNLVMMTIHIDDDVPSDTITQHALPGKWSDVDSEYHRGTQGIGIAWLNEQRTPVLKVPSAMVRQENNVLINPFLIANSKISIVDLVEFKYDQRYLDRLDSK